MSARITYYLGAGASYHSIPVVENLAIRLEVFLDLMRKQFNNEFDAAEQGRIKEYEYLIQEVKRYGTPDTLARNYFLTKNRLLGNLKKLLSSYFIYEQLEKPGIEPNVFDDFTNRHENIEEIFSSMKNTLDRRYTSLFATVLKRDEEGVVLPANVNIVSWNYDSQLERAFQEFCDAGTDMYEVQRILNVKPRLLKVDEREKNRNNHFSIVKLNGTGGFVAKDSEQLLFDFMSHSANKDSWDIIRKILFTQRDEYSNRLYFAWEERSHRKQEDDVFTMLLGVQMRRTQITLPPLGDWQLT